MIEFVREMDKNYLKIVNDTGCSDYCMKMLENNVIEGFLSTIYAETHNIKTNTTITINNLIGDGLISKNLKNPKEDVVVENDNTIKGVIVEWKNNEKKCTIKTS